MKLLVYSCLALTVASCLEAGTGTPKKEKLLIAVPTYNEKENIADLCAALREQAPDADIFIIDDNSPDGTGEIADELANKDKHITVLHREGKLGLGTAQMASYEHARNNGYTYLITMDADFTHDPKYIPAMREKMEESCADVVVGSRYAEGGEMQNWGGFRLMLTKFWCGCLRLGTGMTGDCTGAFRLYKVAVLDPEIYTSITAPGFSFGLEFLFRLHQSGAKIEQVGIVAKGREEGKGESKLSSTEMWQMIKSYAHIINLRMFSSKPQKKTGPCRKHYKKIDERTA